LQLFEKINKFSRSYTVLFVFVFIVISVSVYSIFYILTADPTQQVLLPGFAAVFSVWQIFMSAVTVWVMSKTKVFDINDFKFKGLGKGLLLAWFCNFLSIATFVMLLMQLPENSLITPNLLYIAALILHTLCIAVYEETLIRGFALKHLLKKMGNTKKGIIAACFVSSIFFGVAHITNFIKGDSLMQVVPQIFSTTAMGLYFAALYLRTKTLWVPTLVHMLVNLSSYIFNAIVSYDVMEQMAQSSTNMAGSIANRALLTVVFLIAGLILLRKINPDESANANT